MVRKTLSPVTSRIIKKPGDSSELYYSEWTGCTNVKVTNSVEMCVIFCKELGKLFPAFFRRMKRSECFSRLKIQVGIAFIFFSLGIWGGMRVQSEQSYFEHTIDEVDFEYDLATYDRYESKNPDGAVTRKRVQILTWRLYALSQYPESITSKLFYPNKKNQERIEKVWATLLNLHEMVLEEEQKENESQ